MSTHLAEFEIQELCDMQDETVADKHPHIQTCIVCRNRYLFSKDLANALNEIKEEPNDEFFADEIIVRINAIENEIISAVQKKRKSGVYILTTIICLVVLTLFLYAPVRSFISSGKPFELQLLFLCIFALSVFAVSGLFSRYFTRGKENISFSF